MNAETLIDHAWGFEPCGIEDAKAVNVERKSLSQGQVLKEPYNYQKTRLIVKEMVDLLVLDLVDKGLVTDQIVLTIGYDRESLELNGSSYYYSSTGKLYTGKITTDHYGRTIPYHAHGTENLKDYCPATAGYTSSTEIIMTAMLSLFEKITDKDLFARRINVVAARVKPREEISAPVPHYEQLDLFTDYAALERERAEEQAKREKEYNLQMAMLKMKKKFGKNAVLKGMNLEEGGTTIERNGQIGGHRSGD